MSSKSAAVTLVAPDVRKRFLAMLGRLDGVLEADPNAAVRRCGTFSASASRCSRTSPGSTCGPTIRWGLHRSCQMQEQVRKLW